MVDVGPRAGGAGDCLRRAGVDHLPMLVLTHADADHIGALEEVLDSVQVDRVLVPSTTDPRMAVVAAEMREDDVEVSPLVAGSASSGAAAPWGGGALDVGALRLTPLWPTDRAVELGGPEAANDLSLTFWVEAPGVDTLVHGDLGESAQAALARARPELWTVKPDVVVVAHHGSPDQDPQLLRAAAGRIALISVGAENDYGHPAPATVAALEEAGAVVVRTDVCGAVAVAPGPGGTLRLTGCGADRGGTR